jgi:hypothetical protein
MMQKFLMMSMGVCPYAGGGAAGDVGRPPFGKACPGMDDIRGSAKVDLVCGVHGRTSRGVPDPEPGPGARPAGRNTCEFVPPVPRAGVTIRDYSMGAPLPEHGIE